MKQKHLLRFAIIAALFTQIGHTASVFNNLSVLDDITKTLSNWDTFTGYVFAVSLEMAIYIFTSKGKMNEARFFGIVSFIVNCMYYHKTGEVNFMTVCSVFFSAIIPVTIWFYAKLLHEQDANEAEQQNRIVELETEVTALKAELETFKNAEADKLAKVAAQTLKRKETEAKKKEAAEKKKQLRHRSTVEKVYDKMPEIMAPISLGAVI